MAIAMTVPGGIRRRQVALVAAHLVGATLGGASVGAVLGAVGAAVALERLSVPILVTVAVAIALATLRPHGRSYGIRCQVPRRWSTRETYAVAFAWGALLGSGFATLVPYPAYFFLPALELLVGIQAAAVAGAAFGLGRELVVLWPLLAGRDPEHAMNLLEPMRRFGKRMNAALLVAIVAGTIAYWVVT
jgi:hypothetical protein